MYYRYHTSVLIWVYHSTHASFFPYMGDTKFYSKLCGGYASPNACFKTERQHGETTWNGEKVEYKGRQVTSIHSEKNLVLCQNWWRRWIAQILLLLLVLSIAITMMLGMTWKFLTKSKLTYLKNINVLSVKKFWKMPSSLYQIPMFPQGHAVRVTCTHTQQIPGS